MPQWRKQYAGVEEMTVAVMGCVVNGPGESKHANIGISLPGTGERAGRAGVRRWREDRTLKGERIAEEFQDARGGIRRAHYAPRADRHERT